MTLQTHTTESSTETDPVEQYLIDPESLPTPPAIVLEIIRKADEPDVSIGEISKLVERDAPMAARFIQMANSGLFSPSHEINSVQRALMVVGLRSVRMLALSASLRSLLPAGAAANASQAARHRCVVNAIAAKHFAGSVDTAAGDDAFLAGLLGHMGTIVVANQEPARYTALAAAAGGWPSVADQRQEFGFAFDELTARLITSWGLPQRLADSLIDRSTPVAEPGSDALAAGLRIGFLAEDALLSSDGRAAGELFELAQTAFDMDQEAASAILVEMEEDVQGTATLLTFEFPAGASHHQLLAEATLRMQNLTMETVSAIQGGVSANEALKERNDELEVRTRHDHLTGLLNRGAIDQLIEDEIKRRAVAPNTDLLGLLMLDIDHFKSVNDTHGHVVGDEVLRQVAQAISDASRRGEHVARYGGEEFVLLMPRTELDEMQLAAERIRRAVASLAVDIPGGELSVTISVGGAAVRNPTGLSTAVAVLERADAGLYESKQTGRNRSTIDHDVL